MKIRSAYKDELHEIRELLTTGDLPVDDVSEAAPISFLVAANDVRPISGCVGLEAHGEAGLLRSLAVAKEARGMRIGRALVAAVENAARLRGIADLYLLTTTASQFFISAGYVVVERSLAPEVLQKSTQFASLCPASAVCLRKTIQPV